MMSWLESIWTGLENVSNYVNHSRDALRGALQVIVHSVSFVDYFVDYMPYYIAVGIMAFLFVYVIRFLLFR